ncbi:Prefoldin [Hyaloraphidium curvatum]|nr:Prefoldin [Hyaloraphidium curvatum]
MALVQVQQRLETEINSFNALQKEYTRAVATRTQLESQLNENEMVKKEFDLLDDEATVFKLIGPVLVKQDLVEAKTNVDKRIEFITNNMKDVEAKLKTLEEQQSKKQAEVLKIQSIFQNMQLQAQKAGQ